MQARNYSSDAWLMETQGFIARQWLINLILPFKCKNKVIVSKWGRVKYGVRSRTVEFFRRSEAQTFQPSPMSRTSKSLTAQMAQPG